MRPPSSLILPDGVWVTKPIVGGGRTEIRIVGQKVQPAYIVGGAVSQAEWFTSNELTEFNMVLTTGGIMVLEFGSLFSDVKYYALVNVKTDDVRVLHVGLTARQAMVELNNTLFGIRVENPNGLH